MPEAVLARRARGSLVETAWLEAHLGDPELRVFDCTTHLERDVARPYVPYRVVSGRADYERGHIPGAGFLDVSGELSEARTRLPFMMPSPEPFAATMARHGVGEGTRVVLYSAGRIMWATRVWWMLRTCGFDDVAVLDGGWDQWCAERRAISTASCCYPPARFRAAPRAGLVVDKEAVLAALGDGDTCIVNALNPALHRGEGPSRYGRAGRVPGSVNVPAASLLDADTHAFVPLAEAEARFRAVGVERGKRIICYCGGGISATVDLFLLHRLGHEHIALYDASLAEWAQDASLPIETG